MVQGIADVIEALLASELGATGHAANNRFSLEGLTFSPQADGGLQIGIQRFEAASLRLAFGPLMLEVGRLTLHQLVGRLRTEEGRPRLASLEAADVELTRVKVRGPSTFPPEAQGGLQRTRVRHSPRPSGDSAAAVPAVAGAWGLGPLAAAEGTIRAKIVDAALLFDADVTVPIRRGQIDFNETTVEHVGPDSSMGVSRLGLYVDAPNGRSYIYQFSSVPVAGVEFEQRGPLLGAWVTDRGKLRLQAFGEGLLLQGPGGPGVGFTEQARLLLDRTAVSGDVKPSDGKFTAPGVEAHLAGSADGRNAIHVKSGAVGRGITLEIASLSVRHAVLNALGAQLTCDEIAGSLILRAQVQGKQLHLACEVSTMKISGLRLAAPCHDSA